MSAAPVSRPFLPISWPGSSFTFSYMGHERAVELLVQVASEENPGVVRAFVDAEDDVFVLIDNAMHAVGASLVWEETDGGFLVRRRGDGSVFFRVHHKAAPPPEWSTGKYWGAHDRVISFTAETYTPHCGSASVLQILPESAKPGPPAPWSGFDESPSPIQRAAELATWLEKGPDGIRRVETARHDALDYLYAYTAVNVSKRKHVFDVEVADRGTATEVAEELLRRIRRIYHVTSTKVSASDDGRAVDVMVGVLVCRVHYMPPRAPARANRVFWFFTEPDECATRVGRHVQFVEGAVPMEVDGE